MSDQQSAVAMLIEPELEDASIVLLGDFNPAIFNPDWLAANEIVGPQAAENNKIQIIHPELAQFRVGDFEMTIDRKRFQVLTRTAPFIKILDLVSKTFRDSLPHTPIGSFGINRSAHFKVQSEEVRNAIGRALAPTEPWGDWGREIEIGSGDLRGGMISLSMQAVRKGDGLTRKTTATVQPSSLVLNRVGIFVGVNDHHDPDEGVTNDEALGKLESRFEASQVDSGRIINCVMALKDKVHASV